MATSVYPAVPRIAGSALVPWMLAFQLATSGIDGDNRCAETLGAPNTTPAVATTSTHITGRSRIMSLLSRRLPGSHAGNRADGSVKVDHAHDVVRLVGDVQ